MAIGWLTVLKSVPWTEVIVNAPKVADGAKKLWNSVGKKAPLPNAEAAPPREPIADPLSNLQTRLVAIEGATRDLHEQMLASAEVMKSLAEQNGQLLQALELTRVRLRRLLVSVVIIGIAALVALAWSAQR